MRGSNSASGVLRTIGGILVVIGVWSAVLPYVGPAFGYPMPPGSDMPAWQWTAAHFQLHLLPGVVMMAGGLLLFVRASGAVALGSLLALAAGAWHAWGPFISDAWLGGGGGGRGEVSTAMQILTPLGYHWVPAVLAVGLSAFALGWVARPGERTDQDRAREDRPAPRPAEEREREPVA